MSVSLHQLKRELDRLEQTLNPGAGYVMPTEQKRRLLDLIIRRYEDEPERYEQMAQKYPFVRGVVARLQALQELHQEGPLDADEGPSPRGI